MATPPTWGSSAGTNSNESVPSVSTNSDGTNDSETGADEEGANDAEGVWSPDIEQSFQEALAIYPPCGRRKIILSDEGKMYGRNELIARYIKLRTGKTRSRKQVSSHIQVLARRKSKDIQTQLKTCPSAIAKERALQSLNSMSSAQIVSASSMRPGMMGQSMGMHSMGSGMGGMPFHHPATSQHGGWPGASPQRVDLKYYGGNPDPINMDIKPMLPLSPHLSASGAPQGNLLGPAWEGRSIAGPKLRLCNFLTFLELPQTADGNGHPNNKQTHIFAEIGGAPPTYADPALEVVDVRQIYDKFPSNKGGLQDLYEKGPSGAFFLVKVWADLSVNVSEDARDTFYGVTSQYESSEQLSISCSTKVCSFGKQVVEKVETEHPKWENGRYVYNIHRSPLCEYMVTFIHKLKQLPESYMMNSVLENFTILQVVQNRETQETLLCIAFVFEVSTEPNTTQHHIYKLVKE